MARRLALAFAFLVVSGPAWPNGPEGGPDSIMTPSGYVEPGAVHRAGPRGDRAAPRIARRAVAGAALAADRGARLAFGAGLRAVEEARRHLGKTAREIGLSRSTLWCGTFLGEATSLPHPRNYQLAAAWAGIGRRIGGPQPGAIALVRRGGHIGHVGLVTGTDANGNPVIISGNHQNRVAEVAYPRRAVAAYILP